MNTSDEKYGNKFIIDVSIQMRLDWNEIDFVLW
jgi:hypothetical protein